ncbi:MAG: phosphate ABC transporter substrate-binding protein PstS [Burkholderiales bacterium]|nr:MAG: phosphate ABC transporter substrate-binding protein PstS [Burkholderiales bacterium]
MKRRVVLLAWAGGGLVPPVRAAEAELRGAGATFPAPVYARWMQDYRRATGIAVSYDPVGSGAGIEALAQGRADFGATDVPLAPAELQRLGALQFPTVIGGVVPVVKLPGIDAGRLRLTGALLADIYLGRVTQWNAPAIASLNPGLPLPSSHITVIHRAEASGTTALWSDFLSRASVPWRARMGSGQRLDWPSGPSFVAATGNEGVASAVQRTWASIGYVEASFAARHHLATAALRNRDGEFVRATRPAFEAAAAQARWRDETDLVQSLMDLPGSNTWPLVSASHAVVPWQPAARARELLRFFDWALGQGQAAAELGYLPLPEAAVQLVRRQWAER